MERLREHPGRPSTPSSWRRKSDRDFVIRRQRKTWDASEPLCSFLADSGVLVDVRVGSAETAFNWGRWWRGDEETDKLIEIWQKFGVPDPSRRIFEILHEGT